MAKRPKTHHNTRTESVRQRAYVHILRQIALGEMKSGSNISELDLARELGSSRTPVREAIGQLVAEGLLEQSPGGGTLVVQLQREDIVNLYELREALEVYSIGKVARSGINAEDQGRLQKLIDQTLVLKKELEDTGSAYLNAEQMNRFIACDLGFHAMLMSMVRNPRIQKVINETRLLIRIFAIRRQGHDVASLERIYRQHQELLNGVAAQERDLVMKLMAEHIRHSQQERIEELDLWEREASIRASIPVFFDVNDSLMPR